ncbi:MAG: substrate-binding periplasmic protein [Mangrovibacterium sp.]
MKKLKSSLVYILVSTCFLYQSCNKDDHDSSQIQLRFISEEFNPFNYTVDSKAAGLAPDLLKEICSQLDIAYKIEFLPWEEGYDAALKNENTVLFSTALNSTRKDKFKWAGPIASLDWNFYATPHNSFTLDNLDDAKTVGKIGVIADYATEEYLVQENFTNLVYCDDLADAVNKLLNGEIDLFPSDPYTTEATLKSMGKSPYALNSLLTIQTELLYFAFNINTSDKIIADFQEAIDATKKNGKLKALTQIYFNTSRYPDIMQIYTEPYPPLSFRDKNGEIKGYGTDIVKEIMKRNQIYYEINLSSWSNGYQLALNHPNFCLFTMDRTEIRENLFQWVGPIGTNTTWFYTKTGSGISISSMADARNLGSIGTVSSWFSTQYLQNQGFTNLVYDSDPNVLTEKLMKGQLDAFVCTDITFPDILAELGYDYSEVKSAFSLMSSDFYIAFSKTTSTGTVAQWQSALQAINNDGTLDAIKQKWFPTIN